MRALARSQRETEKAPTGRINHNRRPADVLNIKLENARIREIKVESSRSQMNLYSQPGKVYCRRIPERDEQRIIFKQNRRLNFALGIIFLTG